MLGISTLDKIEIVNIADILYIKADGKYSHFYLKDSSKKVVSKNLEEYQKFLQVHSP